MDINTHSFRIALATSALAAGASDSLISSLGRWTSDCYLRCPRISDNEISHFHKNMENVAFPNFVLDPDKWQFIYKLDLKVVSNKFKLQYIFLHL